MALFRISTRSKIMNQVEECNVILPDGLTEDVPWVLLLHGLSGNQDDWIRYTAIERNANQKGFAVVMPSAGKSWYSDQVYGLPYYTFITEELIDYLRQFFPLSRERGKTFVAGLSMGGYGALKIGLNHPERFAAIASLSGVVDIYHRFRTDGKGRGIGCESMAAQCWGLDFEKVLLEAPNNIYKLLDAFEPDDPALPGLFIACGTDDRLFARNEELREYLTGRGFHFVYKSRPGAHTWDVWDYYIPEALDFFNGCMGR